MSRTIEFWYEFASTYSYPAAMRVEEVAARSDVAVSWRPFLLGPIFRELGWSTSPFNLQPAKGVYMWRDLERTCNGLDLPFRRPDPFPQNSLLAARVAISLTDPKARAGFSRAVYLRQYGEGLSISDPEDLTDPLRAAGVDPADALRTATLQETKDALKTQTQDAASFGIFGAPTWRTPDGEIFWGNDRLEDALDWVIKRVSRV